MREDGTDRGDKAGGRGGPGRREGGGSMERKEYMLREVLKDKGREEEKKERMRKRDL